MIIFFGMAGSGKSVQSEKLSTAINWPHISAGAALRASDDSQVKADLAKGELADYRITNRLMRQTLDDVNNRLILDGYPRQIEQAQWLIDEQRPIELCIWLDVSEEVIRQRLAERGRHDDTAEAIHRRLEIFNQETAEVLDLFKQHQIKIIKVDGSGSIEQVHQRVLQEVQNVLATN